MASFIIAEAGVNHNGDLNKALDLIDVAADSGADAVKFQTFRAEALATPDASKAAYQAQHTDPNESQVAMLRRLELSESDHKNLKKKCGERGIRFLSTPFDRKSLAFLTDEMNINLIKISSGELTNGPLLLDAARRNVNIVMSTGMANIDEISEALAVIAFGYCLPEAAPSSEAFAEIFASKQGQAVLREKVTLLQCTTAYPAPLEETNLRAMKSLRKTFGVQVGYSDHTLGTIIPVAAVACGAIIIEKHFTLDRSLPGPDHRASLEPDELKEMIEAIRIVEAALGDESKTLQSSERENKPIARKSLVALNDMAAGEVFNEQNLGALRPGDGISPMRYWDMIGKSTIKAIQAGEKIKE